MSTRLCLHRRGGICCPSTQKPSERSSSTSYPSTSAASTATPGPATAPTSSPSAGPAVGPGTGPVPSAQATPAPGPIEVVQDILDTTVTEVSKLVKPEVAAAVVTTLGFPMVLALAVVIFLAVQNLLDRRDPKLHAAPLATAELMLPFESEEEL